MTSAPAGNAGEEVEGIDTGEELVEATKGSLRSKLKRIIRKNNLRDDTWEELEKQILKARDEALGWSRSIMKEGKLLWDTSDILGRSNNVVFRQGAVQSQSWCSQRFVLYNVLYTAAAVFCISSESVLRRNQAIGSATKVRENVIDYYYHHHHKEKDESLFLAMELADGGSFLALSN